MPKVTPPGSRCICAGTMLALANTDPLVLLIRLLVGSLIVITWFLMPAPIRICSLAALTFFLYHWRVYHVPFARMLTGE